MGRQYRADINGSRAIAVLMVVIFHLNPLWMPGGFVGVDVFFVISGYLITRNIFEDLDRDAGFSLKSFYIARARRLLPALLAVLLVTTLGSLAILMPLDLKEYGESLVAAVLWSSNIYFEIKSGYFDTEAEVKPLLHIWSLSVEEQFYFCYPFILLTAARFGKKNVAWVIMTISLLSFVSGQYAINAGNKTAAFYMLWSRAWEFGAGGLLVAIQRAGYRNPHPLLPAWLAPVGLALLCVCAWGYDKDTTFPGQGALLPVFATALVIASGNSTFKTRLLEGGLAQYLGSASYSIYLVHWPLIVFAKYVGGGSALTTYQCIGILAVNLILADLCWRYIENRWRKSPPTVLWGIAAVICVFCATGYLFRYTSGLPERLSPSVKQYAFAAFDINPSRSRCSSLPLSRLNEKNICIVGDPKTAPSFALIGDSFADAASEGVNLAARESGVSGYVLTRGGCVPLKDVVQANDQDCAAFNAYAMSFVKAQRLKKVILVARWTTAYTGTRFESGEKTPEIHVRDNRSVRGPAAFEAGIRSTLDSLNPARVYVMVGLPEQQANIPRYLGVTTWMGRTPDIGVPRAQYDARQRGVKSILLREVAKRDYAKYMDFGDLMCHSDFCASHTAGFAYYVDANHLSASAARHFRQPFRSAFQDQGEKQIKVLLNENK